LRDNCSRFLKDNLPFMSFITNSISALKTVLYNCCSILILQICIVCSHKNSILLSVCVVFRVFLVKANYLVVSLDMIRRIVKGFRACPGEG